MAETLIKLNTSSTAFTALYAGISAICSILITVFTIMIWYQSQSQTKAVEEVKTYVAKAVKAAFYGGMEGIGAARAGLSERSSHFFGGQEAPTFYDTSAELALANLGSGGDEYSDQHRKKYGMPLKKAESFSSPEERLYRQ